MVKRVYVENINTREYWNKEHLSWSEGFDSSLEISEGFKELGVPQGASVIDVGAGTGRVLRRLLLERSDLKLSGCDFSIVAMDKLGSVGLPLQLFEMDILSPVSGWGKPPYLYDVVICTETLEHVEDLCLAILNLVKASKRWVFISVPNEKHIQGREHVWEFTQRDVEELLGVFGKVVIRYPKNPRVIVGLLTKGSSGTCGV